MRNKTVQEIKWDSLGKNHSELTESATPIPWNPQHSVSLFQLYFSHGESTQPAYCRKTHRPGLVSQCTHLLRSAYLAFACRRRTSRGHQAGEVHADRKLTLCHSYHQLWGQQLLHHLWGRNVYYCKATGNIPGRCSRGSKEAQGKINVGLVGKTHHCEAASEAAIAAVSRLIS